MGGSDRREMSKTWCQVATCEERIQLLKKLIRLEIGVAEVEEFGLNIQSKFKSFAFKNRVKDGEILSKEVLKEIMKLKLRDEKKYLKELLITKNKMRTELDNELKKNSRPSRRLLKEFREESARVRIEIREKYKVKIEHLRRKYREDKEEQLRRIPPDMLEIGGLRIFDPQRYNEIEVEKYEVKVIGDVQLEENELKVLKLHPKFAILPRLHEGGLDLDEELANSKLRMQISKEIQEKKESAQRLESPVDVEKSDEDMIAEIEMEARSRQVFNPVDKTYDERKRRATDLKECNRITLPKPLPPTEEAKIDIRREIHKKIYDKYREENCSKSGEQRSNLTREEQEGLKSLEKKVKERSLIVIKTDKSGRFAVTSEEAYLRMGQVHSKKDKVISRKELVESEKLLNAHCVAWGKIWRSGDNHDHRGRIVNSKKTSSENTADMYILLKDHKEGEKTRPIVTGCTSNTLGMSNNTACVLEAIAASEEDPFESISSEDMLAKTKEYNKVVLERREERKKRGFCFCNNNNKRKEWTPEGLGSGMNKEIPVDPTPQEPTRGDEEEEKEDERSRGQEAGVLTSREAAEEEREVVEVDLLEESLEKEAGARMSREVEEERKVMGGDLFEERDIPQSTPQEIPLTTSVDLLLPREHELEGGADPDGEAEAEAPQGHEKDEFCQTCEETCLIGCDVVALFPSLTSKRTGEIIRERVMKSKLVFEGFDYDQGRRYIVLNRHLTGNMKDLSKTLPWRRKDGGTVPTMTGSMGSKLDDDPEGQWIFPEKKLTDAEKLEIVARVIEIGVRIVFENFCYKFGGETLKQGAGGPIGARVTMAAARIVMQSWAEKYLKILENSGMRVGLLTGYVDDVRQVSSCLKQGMRYCKDSKIFAYSEQARKEDLEKKQQGESMNSRMARVCQEAMNDVNMDLQFTVEVPEDFENERLPTLDFALWMEDGLLTHTYYQKGMKTPYVVMERTAMGSKQKVEILSNEVVRRLTNVDHERLGAEEQIRVLEQMTQELRNSGYSVEQAREILISGFRGWKRRIERRGAAGLYRAAKDTLEEREKKKLVERETWFIPRKEGEKDDHERKFLKARRRLPRKSRVKQKAAEPGKPEKPGLIKAVMFAPCTVGSQLTKELRKAENGLGESTGAKLKIVERCGMKISDILTSSDPWKGKDCLRDGCLLCQTKNLTGKLLSQDCRRRSVVYETYCITCLDRKVKEIEQKYMENENPEAMRNEISEIRINKYIGETGKSCFERGLQHLSDATQLKPSSHILKHFLESHENEKLDEITFGMKIKCTAKSAFERQIMESVLIQQESSKHNILNSKSEYNRCALPRLTTKLGEEEFESWRKDQIEEKKKEEDLERRIRLLRKERNKGRNVQSNTMHLPPLKKRKLLGGKFKTVKQMLEGWKKEEREREEDTPEVEKKVKKKQKNTPSETKSEVTETEKKTDDDIVIEVDWDKEIKIHSTEIEKETDEEELDARNPHGRKMIENYNQSWELLKECVEYLRENEECWRKGAEEREKERLKLERLQRAKLKSSESRKKHLQKTISEHFQKLPRRERERIEREEIVEKRLELKVIKQELWTHRGKEKKEKHQVTQKKGECRLMREKLEKIKEARDRLEKEKVLEAEIKKKTEERMEELRKQRRLEDIRILKIREEKRKKVEMKQKKEKRWEMARWVHGYIEENSGRWEKEKLKRLEERRKLLDEWERNSRREKIKILKEKFKKKREEQLTEAEKVDLEEKEILEETKRVEKCWVEWRNIEQEVCEDSKTEESLIESPIENEKSEEPEMEVSDDKHLVECLERVEAEFGGGEEKEDEDEKDEEEDLYDDRFCLACVHRPCLCILLKAEMKIENLKMNNWTPKNQQKGEIKNDGVEDVEVSVQKLPSSLYCHPPAQSPNKYHGTVHITDHHHKPGIEKNGEEDHHTMIKEIVLELLIISENKSKSRSRSHSTKPNIMKQSSIRNYYLGSIRSLNPKVSNSPSPTKAKSIIKFKNNIKAQPSHKRDIKIMGNNDANSTKLSCETMPMPKLKLNPEKVKKNNQLKDSPPNPVEAKLTGNNFPPQPTDQTQPKPTNTPTHQPLAPTELTPHPPIVPTTTNRPPTTTTQNNQPTLHQGKGKLSIETLEKFNILMGGRSFTPGPTHQQPTTPLMRPTPQPPELIPTIGTTKKQPIKGTILKSKEPDLDDQPQHKQTNTPTYQPLAPIELNPHPPIASNNLRRRISSSMLEKFNNMLGKESLSTPNLQPPTHQPTPTQEIVTNPRKPLQMGKPVQLDKNQRYQAQLNLKLKVKEDKLPQKKLKGVQKTGSPRTGVKKSEKVRVDKKMGDCLKNWLKNEGRADPHREVGGRRAGVQHDDKGAGVVEH